MELIAIWLYKQVMRNLECECSIGNLHLLTPYVNPLRLRYMMTSSTRLLNVKHAKRPLWPNDKYVPSTLPSQNIPQPRMSI